MLEQSQRPVKVVLLVVLAIALIALVSVILAQRGMFGNPAPTPQPVSKTTIPVPTGTATAPASTATPVVPKQLKDLQDQVNAGTLSPAEAKKRLEALSVP
ncbi:MAG: hypothetical protein WA054_01260, partial [Candidatus Moraniibacteriota bacterium]